MQNENDIYPLEFSLKGNNTIYVNCEHRGCQQNYAICCNILKAREEGRRKSEDACSREIDKNICEAKKMRAEEISAGHAIYYKPRQVAPPIQPVERQEKGSSYKIDYQSSSYRRGLGTYKTPVNPGPKVVKSVESLKSKPKEDVTDFSASISKALKEQMSAPVVKQEPVAEKIEPPKQESVLEKARRLAREKAG